MDPDRPGPASAASTPSASAPSGATPTNTAPRRPVRREPSGPSRRQVWRWLVPIVAAVVLGAVIGVGFASAIHVPRVDSVQSLRLGGETLLLDKDGRSFQTFARQRRIPLQEGDLPELLQNAIVAAEDSHFFTHGGIDAQGVLRAAVKNLRAGRKREGASTITMQLARLLYLHPRKDWKRKVEESFVAVELEKQLSKPQVLTLYCNLVNLGHGNYGMAAASKAFFDKPVSQLTLAEAATLAGIVQRPTDFSPYRNPEGVVKRRNYVLRRMLEDGYIDQAEHDAAQVAPLVVTRKRPEDPLAPYFAEDVRRHLESEYGAAAIYDQGLSVRTTLDARIQRAAEDSLRWGLSRLDHRKGWRGPIERIPIAELQTRQYASWDTWTGEIGHWVQGVVVETGDEVARVRIANQVYPLDRDGIRWTRRVRPAEVVRPGDVAWFRLTTAEREEADAQPPGYRPPRPAKPLPPSAPFLMIEQEPEIEGIQLVLENSTGAVRALVGGWSFGRSQFDRATQAQRQVGSAFKPFVYGAALESGYTPADTLFDAPALFPGADGRLNYSPRNYYRKYFGIVTLRRALEQSLNVSAVKLQDLVGIDRVVAFARRAGIDEPLPPYPSLALGTADLTPIKLAAAYSAIANQGVGLSPYMIESVSDADGETLERHVAAARKAMSPQVAYLLTHMLEGVVDRGTAANMAALPLDLAGKTGTTDDYSDAWFAGFTPRYTIVTWVGYDQKRSLGRNMTGAEAALPAWKRLVEIGLHQGWLRDTDRFAQPPGVTMLNVDAATGALVQTGGPGTVQEAFIEGTEPQRIQEGRLAAVRDLPWFQQRAFYTPREGERMPDEINNWEEVEKNWEEADEEKPPPAVQP
jgi:penicillin-binding protein 1A